MKKLTSLLLVLFAALLLVGCSCDPGGNGGEQEEQKEKFLGGYASLVDPEGYKYQYDSKVKDGYISLANKFANAPAEGKAGIDGLGKTYKIAGQEIAIKNYYKGVYSIDTTQEHFNCLINPWNHNSEKYTNMVDGLIENNKHGGLVGALAKGYKIEDADGGAKEIYTFQMHEGVKWVDNETGKVYIDTNGKEAEVTAEDFVAGLEYVLNPRLESTTVQIVIDLIDGAKKYYEAHTIKNSVDSYNANQEAWVNAWIANNTQDDFGGNTVVPNASQAHEAAAAEAEKLAGMTAALNFDTVGVKVVSKYEVAYKLVDKIPYFLSKLTHSPFLPVYKPYLEKMGSQFGIGQNHILVNGAYRMTRYEREIKIQYTKNTKYYDVDHVYIDHIELQCYDTRFVLNSKLRELFDIGVIDSFVINESDTEGFEEYIAGPNGTGTLEEPAYPLCNSIPSIGEAAFFGYFNFNRTFYQYPTNIASKTDKEKLATKEAIKNINFRLGFQYGQNSLKYLACYNPNFPSQWLMRGYTVRELATDENGKDYADHVDEVWREKQGIASGVSLMGFLNGKGSADPTYSPTKAAEYFALAKAELITSGKLTEADFLIKIDVIGTMNAAFRPYQTATYNSITENSGGVVVIQNLVMDYTYQNERWGFNYDYSLWGGWGPDYADPKTFLHTMIVGGDMVEMLGFDAESLKDPAIAALQEEILGPYTA